MGTYGPGGHMYYLLGQRQIAALKIEKILWNDAPESSFKELKHMVYAKTLISYPDWKLPFTVHIDASDKQLCAVISQDNKTISFFSIILSNL